MNKSLDVGTKSFSALAAALLSTTIFTPLAQAEDNLPTGGKVVSGSASIQTNGRSLEIVQSSDKLIANWNNFSIGKDNSVIFNQPNAQSVALNRVIGQNPSRILGGLIANGRVVLVNPNGIVIGTDGSVQVGGFVGSTLGISDSDFLNDQLRFTGINGSILNQGDLKGAVVALIAPKIINEGSITGSTALAAGTDVTLDFDGNGLIAIEVNASTLETLVENSGLIKADGGVAVLTARGASNAMKGIVNNSGVVEAQSLEKRDDRILLLGDMDYGEVKAAGSLNASFVETSAASVKIDNSLNVDTDGGTWLIDPNDFSIAASGGNITGATLSNNLSNGNVVITTASQGTPNGNGDIFVNDTVTWSANVLTLNADRNIEIASEMFGSGTAGLALEYAQTDASGDYFVDAPVNLASTGSFSTKRAVEESIDYTIITELGNEDSVRDDTLQGMVTDSGYISPPPTNYVLGTNIDAASAVTWNDGAGFRPILEFYGHFDGLGHTISNLTIQNVAVLNEFGGLDFPFRNGGGGSAGLFANFSGPSIRNLALVEVDIMGGSRVGALAGSMLGVSAINVSITGRIEGNRYVGGLAGQVTSNGGVVSSLAGVAVEADVFGVMNGALTNESFAVGGIIGSLDTGATLFGSRFSGNVEGDNTVGGLVGINGTSNIQESWSNGAVSGQTKVGGLVGANGSETINCGPPSCVPGSGQGRGALIVDSYSTGAVSGENGVGGIAGENREGSSIERVFSVSPVTGDGDAGALVGLNGGDVLNSFWSRQASGRTVACDSITSCAPTTRNLTLSQFSIRSIFVDAGWDFENVWGIDAEINDGLPFLRATQLVEVAPPPPPPPPEPVTPLTLDDFGMNFSTEKAPFQPTITLSGSGFNDVTEIVFEFTDPDGVFGSVVWNEANNFGGGRFVVSSDTSATIAPVLVTANDSSGDYQWTVTIKTADQSVVQNFVVAYTPVVVPPPPPPEPETPLSLDDFGDSFSTTETPFQPTIALMGSGLSNVAEVRFNFTDPNGQTGSVIWNAANDFGDGRFVVASDTSATIIPVLVAANDPTGTYQWSITLVAGDQSVTQDFSVFYTQTMTPMPSPTPAPTPTPEDPQPLTLSSGILANYFTTESPYRGMFDLSGTGFSSVTEISFVFVDPAGNRGSITWNDANNFGGGRFDPTSDTMAALSPVLVATNDPVGLYRWSITISNGTDTISRDFTVTYALGPIQHGEPVTNVEPRTSSTPRLFPTEAFEVNLQFPEFAQNNPTDTSLYVSQDWAMGNDIDADGNPTGQKRYAVACLAVVYALIEHARGNTGYRIGQLGTWIDKVGAVAPDGISAETTASAGAVKAQLNDGKPVILRGSSPSLPYGQHYMLAIGISDSGNIVAYDPFKGERVQINSNTMTGASSVGNFTITDSRNVKM